MAAVDELPEEVKTFIVMELACWQTPSAVAAAVKQDYGLDVTRQRVEAYDPTKVAGKGLSEQFRKLFEEARAAYLADTAHIGIANRTYRLRTLERLAQKAEAAGNMGMVAQLLEQAAKEVGGAFTNRRELTGLDGKPIATEDKTPKASRADVLNDLADIFGAGTVASPATEEATGSDHVVRKGSRRRGGKKPRASKRG